MNNDITTMSIAEIEQYLTELKEKTFKEKPEKAMKPLIDKYSKAEYIYTKNSDDSISFGKVAYHELRGSVDEKNNDILDIYFEEHYNVSKKTFTDKSCYIGLSMRTNGVISLFADYNNRCEVISEETYNKLLHEYNELDNQINLTKFNINET